MRIIVESVDFTTPMVVTEVEGDPPVPKIWMTSTAIGLAASMETRTGVQHLPRRGRGRP